MSRQVVAPPVGRTASDPGTEPSAPWAWTQVILATLCRAALATVVAMAMWAALPAALGWKPTTVSSGSMLPRLRVGDIAVSRPLQRPPALNQVLLYDDPDHPGRLRLHRFVRVDDQGRLVTKGDANPDEDSTAITVDAVRGVAVLRVPYVGLPIVWAREAQWLMVAGAAAALLLLMVGSRLDRRLHARTGAEDDENRPDKNRPDGPESASRGAGLSQNSGRGAGPPPDAGRGAGPEEHQSRTATDLAPGAPATTGWRRWTRAGRVAVASLAGLTVGSLLVTTIGVPAAANFSDTTTNPSNRWSAAPNYTCRAPALALNPYFFYALNETSSAVSVADTSGNGRNGSFNGGVTVGATGACGVTDGTAVTLNGSSGFISTPTSRSAPNTFTAQTWFKTTTTQGGKLVGFGNSRTGVSTTFDRHVYMANNGRLYFGVQSGTKRTTVNTATAYNDGQWHLVTATLSSSGMRLYVDDTLADSDSSVTSGSSYTGYWRIGFDSVTSWTPTPSSRYFAGSLDNVAIYNTALSAGDVSTIFAAGG